MAASIAIGIGAAVGVAEGMAIGGAYGLWAVLLAVGMLLLVVPLAERWAKLLARPSGGVLLAVGGAMLFTVRVATESAVGI